MTWIIAIVGGAAGGVVAGFARSWLDRWLRARDRRRVERRERQMRAEVAREWCGGCGQRFSDGDHSKCEAVL